MEPILTGTIDRIATDAAPPPFGHYVQAAAWGDLVFVSGQLAARPDGSHTAGLPFEDQVRQALANLLSILAAAGSGPDNVLKVTAYIAGVEHWPTFNGIYAEAFPAGRPARSVVPVPALHHGYLIELDAVATRRTESAGE